MLVILSVIKKKNLFFLEVNQIDSVKSVYFNFKLPMSDIIQC